MSLPVWWMPEPARSSDAERLAAFDRVLDVALAAGAARPLSYELPYPKWQFLSHAADRGDVVLHGSDQADVDVFEPRQSGDLTEFGAEKAVFAASDGIWAIFFAVLDRSRYSGTLVNACLRVGKNGPRGYFFSLAREQLAARPWRDGTVYLLPAAAFRPDEPISREGLELWPAQLASTRPVAPMAKLTVTVEDFPFLQDIRGHDEAYLGNAAAENPQGFPWLPTEES